ncbi:MAG: hypothetical protein AAF939_08325 [Planctomycetota bacterium]
MADRGFAPERDFVSRFQADSELREELIAVANQSRSKTLVDAVETLALKYGLRLERDRVQKELAEALATGAISLDEIIN